MQSKNIFEKIINKEIKTNIIYEDKLCIVINDINPQAPIHILVIPKKKIKRLYNIESIKDKYILGHLIFIAKEQIKKYENSENNFRIIINNGSLAGETIPHLHVHVLSGRKLNWPPG